MFTFFHSNTIHVHFVHFSWKKRCRHPAILKIYLFKTHFSIFIQHSIHFCALDIFRTPHKPPIKNTPGWYEIFWMISTNLYTPPCWNPGFALVMLILFWNQNKLRQYRLLFIRAVVLLKGIFYLHNKWT